jgi:hypothetical protein
MKALSVFLGLSLIFVSCGGGGGHSPTEPRQSANVQGAWSGTSTGSKLQGPSCIGNPVPTPVVAAITQSGSAISLKVTFNNALTCSFHGTVGETAISWDPDQQQANTDCVALHNVPCLRPNGSIQFIDTRLQSGTVSGTVSGNHISATGDSVSDVLDSKSGQVIDTFRITARLEMQRQGG